MHLSVLQYELQRKEGRFIAINWVHRNLTTHVKYLKKIKQTKRITN